MADIGNRGDSRSRREYALVLAVGAAGAGIVLLASRQVLARVVVSPPRPLPDSVSLVSGQDLRPAIGALAVAALASLAAVLATRRLLRRVTGLITVALGVGIGLVATPAVTAAQAIAAAKSAGASLASGAGGGNSAGSVSAGAGSAGAGGSDGGVAISGMPVHVLLGDTAWRSIMIVGAVLLIAAGCAVVARANRLPVMSGRYDRPSQPARSARPAAPAGRALPAKAGVGSRMWELLSAGEDPSVGEDPTAGPDLRMSAEGTSAPRPGHAAQPDDLGEQPPAQGRRLLVKPPSVRSGAPGNPPRGGSRTA